MSKFFFQLFTVSKKYKKFADFFKKTDSQNCYNVDILFTPLHQQSKSERYTVQFQISRFYDRKIEP